MPACSPAATRLQNSGSKYSGYLRNAWFRLVPVSTSARMSFISRAIEGFAWPRPTMSNDCIRGTPAFSIVDSCRVKRARSLPVILRPREKLSFLIFVAMMPRRRSAAATTESPPARISPLTTRPFLSRPSHLKTASLVSTRGLAIAPVAIVAPPSVLFVGAAQDLFERGHPLLHFQQPGLPQVAHSVSLCLAPDVERGCMLEDHVLHRLGDRHDLVDAEATLVAAALAALATDRLVRDPAAVEVRLREPGGQQCLRGQLGGLLAGAQPPRKTLGGDQDDARRDVEGRDSHVVESHKCRRRVVRVQRRHHHVARLRCLDRDVRGFEVADLADHDDVRILPQEGPQRVGERKTGLLVDVDLVDARDLDLRRVLGGRDVDA